MACNEISKRLTMFFSLSVAILFGLGLTGPVEVSVSRVCAQEPDAKPESKPAAPASPQITAEQAAAAQAKRVQEIADSLPEQKKHLKENPKDVLARLKYANSLFIVGDARSSWKEVMKTRELEPENQLLVSGIDKLMLHFIQKNIFAIGKSNKQLVAVLGPPTKISKSQNNFVVRYSYGHWAVDFKNGALWRVMDLRGLSDLHFLPDEKLDLEFGDAELRGGLCRVSRLATTTHFYLPGESIRSHTESLVVDRLVGAGENTIRNTTRGLIAHEAKLLPGATHKILSETEDTATFEVIVPEIGSVEAQHRIVRLLKGEKDLFRITRTKLNPDVALSDREEWVETLQAAKLTKVKRDVETSLKTTQEAERLASEEDSDEVASEEASEEAASAVSEQGAPEEEAASGN